MARQARRAPRPHTNSKSSARRANNEATRRGNPADVYTYVEDIPTPGCKVSGAYSARFSVVAKLVAHIALDFPLTIIVNSHYNRL